MIYLPAELPVTVGKQRDLGGPANPRRPDQLENVSDRSECTFRLSDCGRHVFFPFSSRGGPNAPRSGHARERAQINKRALANAYRFDAARGSRARTKINGFASARGRQRTTDFAICECDPRHRTHPTGTHGGAASHAPATLTSAARRLGGRLSISVKLQMAPPRAGLRAARGCARTGVSLCESKPPAGIANVSIADAPARGRESAPPIPTKTMDIIHLTSPGITVIIIICLRHLLKQGSVVVTFSE